MKVTYKGFEIEVKRDKCLAGYSMLYYTVFQIKNGLCLADSFEDSDETVREKIKQLKSLVDDYIENPDDYDQDVS